MKKKYFILIVLILWILFIFFNSLQNAIDSSYRSTYIVNLLNNKFNIELSSDISIRKLAHIFEYFISGCLIFLLASITRFKQLKYMGWISSGSILMALFDETLQCFSQGRSPSIIDVWIDLFGFCLGLILSSLIFLIRKRKTSLKKQF